MRELVNRGRPKWAALGLSNPVGEGCATWHISCEVASGAGSVSTVKHVDHGATNRAIALTLIDRGSQQPLKLRQVDHFRSNTFQVVSGNLPDLAARRLGRSAKRYDCTDLGGCETEFARTTNKPEGADVIGPINSTPPARAGRRRKNANPLEVAYRFDVHAGPARQLADRDAWLDVLENRLLL